MIVDEELYLEHFGVKGMHWGVRNFINTQKTRRLNKYGDKSVKSLTKAQKQARQERNVRRTKIAAASVLLGTYVTLNILAANAQRKVSDTHFQDAFRNAGRARAAASAARGERAVKDIINSERASQAASLLRMHQEGKMTAEQHTRFLDILNKRYDRKIAGLG